MASNEPVQRVRIYLNERDLAAGQPTYLAALERLRREGATGATALRGIAGFGAGHRIRISGADALTTSFVAPAAPGSDVVLRLTARAGAREASDTVTIHIDAPPTVDGGPDRSVAGGERVALAATAADRDGDPLTVGWTQVGGPAVTLAGATTPTPSFTAPVVRRDAVIELEVAVSDGRTSVADRVVVADRRAGARRCGARARDGEGAGRRARCS